MTSETAPDVAKLAAELWGGREADALINARVRELTAGSMTDWGMSGDRPRPKVTPISLAGGIPDAATQPREALIRAMERALDTDDDAPLVYGGAHGYEPLRAEMGTFFSRDHATPFGADGFVLTNGAAGAIDLVCSALLDPGDVVITEVPTFSGSLRTMRGHQAEIVGVHMDEDGLLVDQVEATIEELERAGKRIKLIYTIPTFHNPTGITMSMERREQLVELAARKEIFILEDTAYNELYFGADLVPTVSAVADGHGVITAGTFSKVIATGLRVGWVQAQPDLINAIMPARFDMGNSPLLHRMIYEYMVSGELEQHIGIMRGIYRDKMRTLVDTLRDLCEPYSTLREPKGGFFLWLKMAEGMEAREVQAKAIEEGAIFPIGHAFYPTRDPGEDGESIRLAYSWTTFDDLREGAARLARACAEVAGS